MNREAWYAWYRVQRIIRRHTAQSFHDVMLYGTAVTDLAAIEREIAGERPGPKMSPWDVKIELPANGHCWPRRSM